MNAFFCLLFLVVVFGIVFNSVWSFQPFRLSSIRRMSSSSSKRDGGGGEIDTEEREPIWCPDQQIYIGGIVPGSINNEEVDELIKENNGKLRIFGYGSLCWNPGKNTNAVLSRSGVTTTLGRAVGYKRCWAQKSTDHRGTPNFPGIVCTLLSDEEVRQIITRRRRTKKATTIQNDIMDDDNNDDDDENDDRPPTLTEGLIYTVPENLVDECLSELDFREKGGYARDVINVVEDDTGRTVKALLYRGTPDNPAFWTRALLDLPFAAAIMSSSVGPSGRNDEYLFNLDHFLTDAASASEAAATALKDHVGDNDTGDLASMSRELQQQQLFFLFGSGSNQYNQLLLSSSPSSSTTNNNNPCCLINGDEAHQLTDMVLCTSKPISSRTKDFPKQLYAGGGHSGLLTNNGKLYLWGWNEHGQLGRSSSSSSTTKDTNLVANSHYHVIPELLGINVEVVGMGFSHTLVIEKETGHLFAFGDNSRGQVFPTTTSSTTSILSEPMTPPELMGLRFIDVSAGLFHSAAIDDKGRLVTFGCGGGKKFGQKSLSLPSSSAISWIEPEDGIKFVRVVCGRHHTIIVDEQNRIWSMGENKYGQLGRLIKVAEEDDGNNNKSNKGKKWDNKPNLVDGELGINDVSRKIIDIDCGWSHTVVTVSRKDEGHNLPSVVVYGWGRNDKGQLGTIPSNLQQNRRPNDNNNHDHVLQPTRLFTNFVPEKYHNRENENDHSAMPIQSIVCGSEFTMLVDHEDNIYGCGWNEHGNLALGDNKYDHTTNSKQENDDKSSDIFVDNRNDVKELSKVIGSRITKPPTPVLNQEEKIGSEQDETQYKNGNGINDKNLLLAAGGAHFICSRVMVLDANA